MPDLSPDLTPSQIAIVDRISDAVAVGDRVCLRGEPGAGKSTILRAAAGRVAASLGRSVAVVDAQSSDRLAWGVMRYSGGRCIRPNELTNEGVVLFLDNSDCLVRIREQDPIVIVGDYSTDTVIDIPQWTREDVEECVPLVLDSCGQGPANILRPRFLTLAEACLQIGVTSEYPLPSCRLEYFVARLLERTEVESPLSIDLLFAASELGTLPLETDWFVGWRGISAAEATSAAARLHDLGLVDPHGPGAWTAPAVVRAVVRRQMSVAFRRAAARGLAIRLVEISESQPLAVLPHLTTLWKRVRDSQSELAEQIWGRIEPQWESYGFRFQDDAVQHDAAAASASVARMLVEARQLRQRGSLLEAQHKLAKAVRKAEAVLPEDDPSRFDVRLEYAETSLTGTRRAEAVGELRDLLRSPFAQNEERHKRRIENDLASALFFDGRYAEAATAFAALANGLKVGTGAARAWNNAGECYRSLGEFDQAEAALQRAYNSFENAGAADDPGAISAAMNLGAVFADTGRDAEALVFFESASMRRERSYGADATTTLTAKLNWAMSLYRLGRIDEAARINQNRPHPIVEDTLECAFAILAAAIDRAQGRSVKAELALLRLAPREELSEGLRTEIAHLLADGFLREGRVDEAARWSRIAVDTVRYVARVSPAMAVRVCTTAALIEVAAERWTEALRLANGGLRAAEVTGTVDQQTVLQAVRELASEPGQCKWTIVEEAFECLVSVGCSVDPVCVPVPRLVEHAVATQQGLSALPLIRETIDDFENAPRQWRVVQASLAVLENDNSAAELWQEIAELHPSKDSDEQRLAEKIARELLTEAKQPSDSPCDDASSNPSSDSNVALRAELLNALTQQDHEMADVFDSADELPTDLVTDESESAGHVLDELF